MIHAMFRIEAKINMFKKKKYVKYYQQNAINSHKVENFKMILLISRKKYVMK